MGKKGLGKIRNFLVEQQGGVCFWCGLPIRRASVDHLMPKSKGGTQNGANLVAACLPCNSEKGARSPREYVRFKLVRFEKFLKSDGFRKYRKLR